VSASAKRKAPEPDIAAAAATAGTSAREKQAARWRRRMGMRGHGDEFMDMNVEIEPQWGESVTSTASDRGAGDLGFAGTARTDADVEAAGLASLTGDGFGGGPSVPMVPGTWDPDRR
jgi:PPE-repeat protein